MFDRGHEDPDVNLGSDNNELQVTSLLFNISWVDLLKKWNYFDKAVAVSLHKLQVNYHVQITKIHQDHHMVQYIPLVFKELWKTMMS